jgi:hypothetical protein
VASAEKINMTRKMALNRMMRPLVRGIGRWMFG